jgi:hypothetical protein
MIPMAARRPPALELCPDENGWVRRYIADPAKAEEARVQYQELGFEVDLRRPEPALFGDQCGDCREAACTEYWVIYTRRTR